MLPVEVGVGQWEVQTTECKVSSRYCTTHSQCFVITVNRQEPLKLYKMF